jgi:DNA-binding GntR family transcriptional regulator
MIISDDVIDGQKYETFKQELIGNVLGNQALLGDGSVDIEVIFDTYWIATARPIFLEENNITKSFIDNLEKNDLKDYLIYTPFDSTKQRNLTFTSENSADSGQKKSQENMIKGLANTTNQNTNVLTWNDTNGNGSGAYISKAKLN